MNSETGKLLPSCAPVVAQEPLGTAAEVAAAVPFLPGLGEGEALQLVLMKRLEQIQLGYTPQRDDVSPQHYQVARARDYLTAAIDIDPFGPKDPDASRTVLRLVNAAALIFAAIDRIQRAQKRRHNQSGEQTDHEP